MNLFIPLAQKSQKQTFKKFLKFKKFSQAGSRTQDLLVWFVKTSLALPLSYNNKT